MVQEKYCQNCNQGHQCQEVYRKLGNAKNPSVTFKVVIAFLLPLVVFIAFLATFEQILAKTKIAKELQTALSLPLALAAALLLILTIKAINRKLGKSK